MKLRYLLYCFKRTLKKPVNWLLLILLPVLTVLFLLLMDNENERALKVAVYTSEDNGFSSNIVDKLVHRDGIILFYACESEEELYRDVASGRAECGYVLPESLEENLNAGLKRNLVDLVVSSSTTLSGLTNEIVYAELFEEYSLIILQDYLQNDSAYRTLYADDTLQSDVKIANLYRKYMANGSTFAFDFVGSYSNYSSVTRGLMLHSVTGLVGIIVLLGGFSGLFSYVGDEKNSRFSHVPLREKRILSLICLFCPVLIFWTAGALCLLISGYFTASAMWGRYILYGGLILLLCLIFRLFLRFRTVLSAIMTLYLLGCLIFTPIFIDITADLPYLKPFCRLFIIGYLF